MRERLRHEWSGRALLVALALVTVAIGFCLFDGHAHGTTDNGMSSHPCCGLAIDSVAVIGLTSILVHPLPLDPPYVVHAVPLHRLDPPPKLRWFS